VNLVPTGIQGLDTQFGGGFPRGSNVLLLADPSNAPYVFAEQFAAAGLERGERVYFYSLERPKEEILLGIRSFMTKPAGAELQFFDCYSVKMRPLPAAALKRLGVTNHAVNVTEDVVERLLAEKSTTPFRVIIESVSGAIQTYGLEPTMTMLRQLAAVVQKLGGTSAFLVIKGLHDHTVETAIRHLSDGVIEFGVDRQGFGLYSYISISKMRGVPDATRLLLYKETEKGLWLESTRRVF
jgi:KaiC/GvpD/RAD55 family RecA-like ATPase